MPFPCHAMPCHAAKGLECVFSHLIYTVRTCLIHTCLAMPCPCYAPTMPFFSRSRHNTSVERRPVGYLPALGFFRLLRGVPRMLSDAYQSQMQVAIVKPNTVCHGRGKEWYQQTTQKTICYTVGLAVRIFPATMRTFTKDMALTEQGRGAAWHVWINARHGRGMLCESAFKVTRHTVTLLQAMSSYSTQTNIWSIFVARHFRLWGPWPSLSCLELWNAGKAKKFHVIVNCQLAVAICRSKLHRSHASAIWPP